MGRIAVLALAITLGACATQPPVVLGHRMPAGCSKHDRSERCFGWIFDRLLMTTTFARYRDDDIRAYVASIANRIARANHDRRTWTFRVLDDPEPQAYAGFNATIYITRGALAILRDEAELAAVIGHEMGHTMAGHHRENIAEMFRDVGESEVRQWQELRYARDDEIQADELAVVLIARAGYDVHAVERMLRAIGGTADEDDDHAEDRHPVFTERIARAAALAMHYPAGERFTERYRARVARLIVGDDPFETAVVGDAIVFSRANIALDLPPGSRAFRFRNMVVFVLPNEDVGTVLLLDREVAINTRDTKPSPAVMTVRGDRAVVISMVNKQQPDSDAVNTRLAARLSAKLRTPRASERAHLHPILFDPTAPRPIWAAAAKA